MVSPAAGEIAGESQSRLLAALLELAAGGEAHAALSEIARHAACSLGAEAGGVLRFLGDERAVIVGVWREGGTRGMPINAELDFDRRNSALGRARSAGRPARADSYEGLRGELPLVMEAIGLRSSVAAPILLGERPWGAVVVATTRAEPLPAEAEQRLADLAALLGRALAGADRRRALEESRLRIVEGSDAARRRLERKLHEGPHQHLLALVLQLRVARAQAAEGSELAGALDAAIAAALDADTALRNLGRGIYPVVLTERGLAAAVQGLAVRAAVPVSLRRLPSRRFPALIEATAYLAVVDALAGAAGEATVLLADERDRLVLEVCHEGPAGDALDAMAHRVAAVGGTLAVEPSAGGGTVVRAQLPLEPLKP